MVDDGRWEFPEIEGLDYVLQHATGILVMRTRKKRPPICGFSKSLLPLPGVRHGLPPEAASRQSYANCSTISLYISPETNTSPSHPILYNRKLCQTLVCAIAQRHHERQQCRMPNKLPNILFCAWGLRLLILKRDDQNSQEI